MTAQRKIGDRVRLGSYGDFLVEIEEIQQIPASFDPSVMITRYVGRFCRWDGKTDGENTTTFYNHNIYKP